MKNIALVLLVSKQTIPNFLSIRTFIEANHFVFITTEEMEDKERGNKREWIMSAAGIEERSTSQIVVKAEYKEDVIQNLIAHDWKKYDEIIVNITGGTKMMSLACYEFFKLITHKIWYLPIRSSNYHLCDNSREIRLVDYNCSVSEYLSCCGINANDKRFSEKMLLLEEEYTCQLANGFINQDFDTENLERIRRLFRDNEALYKINRGLGKGIILSEVEEFSFIQPFLNEIKFPSRNKGILDKDEMEYLTGGWFEEFTYQLIKLIINQDEGHIKLGVGLNPQPKDQEKARYFTNNDLDIVFAYRNELYVIECKSGGMDDNELFNKTVYLASALQKYFGLTVNSSLFTLSEMNDRKIEKAETLGVKAVDLSVFKSENRDFLIRQILRLA
jgi:hypothetical protein